MYRNLRIITCLTCILLSSLVLMVTYWLVYPYDPMKIDDDQFQIVYPVEFPHVVKQGEYITYEFTYERTGNVNPIIQRQFVDGLVFNVAGDTAATVIEPGKGTAQVQIAIPQTLPPGRYSLRIISKYQVNPIRLIQYEYYTEEFEVVSGVNSIAEQEALAENREDAE